MSSKVTYRQQFTRCGKQRCRKCSEGGGHGPYWYAYWSEKGRTISKYVGVRLPPHVEATHQQTDEARKAVARSVALQLPSDPILRVYLLGQFRVERKNGNAWLAVDSRGWQRRRVRALFGCLLTSPGRRLGREQAMELLWPGLDIDVAANRLNGAVHELRHLLEPEISRPAASSLLRLERDVLELADSTSIWVDAEAFERLLREAYATPDAEIAERLLEEAAALYGGSYLLEELYSEWTVHRRDALQRSWVGLLLHLAHLRTERGAFTSAIEVLDRLRCVEPTNETALQRLMICLSQLDRRGEALQVYRQHVVMLRREYASEPLPETRHLYEEIRQGHLPPIQSVKPQVARRKAPQEVAESLTPVSSSSSPLEQGSTELSFSRPLFQVGRHTTSPLVGRHRELETMRHVLLSIEVLSEHSTTLGEGMRQQAETPSRPKQAHFFLLLGEPGIGKTRLAEELSLEAYARGWAVAWSRTYEQEGSIPYGAWTEVLRTLLQGLSSFTGSLPAKIPASRRTATHSTDLDLTCLSTLLPELAISATQSAPSPPHEQERLHLWETTLQFLDMLARTYPLLIVLDDLHWADESSIDLLAYLTRHLQDQRVFLIGTCRDAELAPTHKLRGLINDLKRQQAIVPLVIEPLTQSQIGTLVAHLPEDLVRSIQTQAAGNPFFAEELARYADATRSSDISLAPLVPGESQEASPVRASPPSLQGKGGLHPARRHALPEAIAALLDRRLSRLSPACQALVGKAAVLGGSFELSQLLLMATELSEDTVLNLLEEALHAGLLTEEDTSAQITYHFWHPLIVSRLYERLSAARRAQLHRRAAEVIRATHAPSQQEKMAASIVYHLSKGGGDTASIASYAELAGNSAYSLAAYSEAQQHYLQAIHALVGERALVPDSTTLHMPLRDFAHHILEKLSATHSDTQHICRLVEFIAECSAVQGNFADARCLYECMLVLRTSNAFEWQAQARTASSENTYQQEAQIQALLWREIGNTWAATGEYGRAYECYDRGKAVMVEAGVASGAAWACLHLQYGVLLRCEGKYHEAGRYLQEALEMLEHVLPHTTSPHLDTPPFHESHPGRTASPSSSAVSPSRTGLQTRTERALLGDPLDIGYVHEQLGVVAASVGHLSEALKHMHTALSIYERRVLVSEIARLCGNLGNIYIIKGEHASARMYLQRSLDLAERTGDLPNMAFVTNNLGEVAHRSGNLVEAETWFQRSLAHAERINDREHISWCCVDLAAVQRDLGKLQEARASIQRAITTGRAIKSPRCTRYALVALGDLRIIEAIIASTERPKEADASRPSVAWQRLLLRAKSTLRRATSLEGLEAEPMIGGKLLLATAHFLLNDLETARQIVVQTMAEAQQHETTRAIGRAHRLLGRILAAQRQDELADAHYEQAMQIFRERELRLDYARTLQGYGTALVQRSGPGTQYSAERATYRRGLDYLRQARAIFTDCQAIIDRAWAEHVLRHFESLSRGTE